MNEQKSTTDFVHEIASLSPEQLTDEWEMDFSIRFGTFLAGICRKEQFHAHEMFIIGLQNALENPSAALCERVNAISQRIQNWLEDPEAFEKMVRERTASA